MYPWLIAHYQQLSRRAKQNKLHHALLLTGLPGIGKQYFAEQLAAYLFCHNKQTMEPCGHCQGCKLTQAGSHPDYHKLQSDKQIGVDAMRSSINILSAKAQMSAAKVLIIYAADSMTESAANALLKTLEEPTRDTYLILLTAYSERLLPTILSRCEKVQLLPPDSSACLAWLKQQGQTAVTADFVRLYSYAPLRILADLTDNEGLDFADFNQQLQGLQQGSVNPVQLAKDWEQHSEQVVTWLQHWCKEQSRLSAQAEQLWPLYQACQLAKQSLLHPGVNKSLILTGLLTAIHS